MVYQWKDGARVTVDPAIAGQELKRIQQRDGKIEAQVVVDEARPVKSKLHPAFEWNDYVAAEEYRKEQARHMVRSLVVVPEDRPEEVRPVFVGVREIGRDGGYYQDVEVAAQNPDEWAIVMKAANAAVADAERKLSMLRSLSHGKSRKVLGLIKKAGAALGDAKEAMAQIAG